MPASFGKEILSTAVRNWELFHFSIVVNENDIEKKTHLRLFYDYWYPQNSMNTERQKYTFLGTKRHGACIDLIEILWKDSILNIVKWTCSIYGGFLARKAVDAKFGQ